MAKTFDEKMFGSHIVDGETVMDEIKDRMRSKGYTTLESTIMCGNRAYIRMENAMLNYIKAYTHKTPTDADHVFMKNGLTHYLYNTPNLNEWTMIVLTKSPLG